VLLLQSLIDFVTLWVAPKSSFPGNTPARATVEAKLASPDYKVEIMVVAAC
jgi:enamine deaminase RidA (YjgF/YER057c/UK114 family)